MPETLNQYNKSDCNILFAYANIDDRDFNNTKNQYAILSENAVFLAINVDNGIAIFKSDITSRRGSNTIERLLRRQKLVLTFEEGVSYGACEKLMYKLTHRNRIPFFKPHGKRVGVS